MKGGFFLNLLRRIFVHNFYLKFIAAVLTLALFIWVSEDRETVVAGFAPVQIVVPDDMVLVSEPIDRVKVTIRGRWSDVNRFDVGQLEAIRVDLAPTDLDTFVSLTSDMIRVPPGLRVTQIEPSSLAVELESEAYKTVAVRPSIVGEPAPSYSVQEVRAQPQTVTIRGPQSRLDEITAIPTEPVDINGRTNALRRQVHLRPSDGLITPEVNEAVVIEVDIITQEITETFSDFPIVAVNTNYETIIEPATTNITLRGPRPLFAEMDSDALRVEIDLSEENQRPPATYSRSAVVRNIPPGLTLESLYPERFRVTTQEP